MRGFTIGVDVVILSISRCRNAVAPVSRQGSAMAEIAARVPSNPDYAVD
jgi:hypothetical protein